MLNVEWSGKHGLMLTTKLVSDGASMDASDLGSHLIKDTLHSLHAWSGGCATRRPPLLDAREESSWPIGGLVEEAGPCQRIEFAPSCSRPPRSTRPWWDDVVGGRRDCAVMGRRRHRVGQAPVERSVARKAGRGALFGLSLTYVCQSIPFQIPLSPDCFMEGNVIRAPWSCANKSAEHWLKTCVKEINARKAREGGGRNRHT